MDCTKKRPPQNDTVSDIFSNKKPRPKSPPTFPYPEYEDVFLDDELSKLLDEVPTCPPVMFSSNPYLGPPVVGSSYTAYVTINGNEETCGSSFSDTYSSVMAGFDAVNLNLDVAGGGGGEWDEFLLSEQVGKLQGDIIHSSSPRAFA